MGVEHSTTWGQIFALTVSVQRLTLKLDDGSRPSDHYVQLSMILILLHLNRTIVLTSKAVDDCEGKAFSDFTLGHSGLKAVDSDKQIHSFNATDIFT